MAASAYAFLVSLNNTMDQIQFHPFTSTCFDKSQFEALREKADLLVDFVENHSHEIISGTGDLVVDEDELNEAEHLLSRIAVVAQKAEDLIEVEAADRILGRSTEISSSSFLLNLQQKLEEMDHIINEDIVVKVKEVTSRSQDKHPPPPLPSPPPPSSERAKTTSYSSSMVGLDGYLNRLLDELTRDDSGRKILSIVGMGGVGKTTLARNVYEAPLIVESFAVRVWITVSQAFSARDIFEQALSCLGISTSDSKDDDDELGQKLRKSLYGRRYLIVLDDMWSVDAWDKIKFYFPDTSNRSRIVVTTREQQLVDYLASSSAVAVDLLDDQNSWKLFCDKTFGQEGCPPQLKAAGKRIAKKCKGLPLAISVLGGLLRNSPRAQEYWEEIAQDKSLIPQDSGNEGNKLLSLLYTSYKHLPICFKPCFLYLGLFPEDHQIDVSQLIKFWVAEGFIKPKPNLTLEEVAESCLKELVDRNLVLVGALGLNKKLETCSLHDLVRELCIKIAEREKFYCVQRDLAGKNKFVVDRRRKGSYNILEHRKGAAPNKFESRLLRVQVGSIKSSCQEVNVRLYLTGTGTRSVSFAPTKLPSSVLLFWSLQTILCRDTKLVVSLLPDSIWKMPQLRHIEIPLMKLPDPPSTSGDDDGDAIVLQNLQTLKRVSEFNLSKEVCKRIPNVKDLEIGNVPHGEDWDIGCLNKLETLRCSWHIRVPLKSLKLPESLKELSLGGCLLPWSHLAIIGSLPNLQILHLHYRAVVGEEWSLGEEERFLSLKYLKIEACDDLIRWDAEASNFPVLETLFLKYLSNLQEIPSGIGDIPTLEMMKVYYCSESVVMSAIRILEEQESYENLDLHLQLSFVEWSEKKMWKGKIQEMDITCRNLHISTAYRYDPRN